MRYLLQQGDDGWSSGAFDIDGIALKVTLKRHGNDMTILQLPSVDAPINTNTGLILRSATHGIPAPPAVHIPVDIEGMASSIKIDVIDA